MGTHHNSHPEIRHHQALLGDALGNHHRGQPGISSDKGASPPKVKETPDCNLDITDPDEQGSYQLKGINSHMTTTATQNNKSKTQCQKILNVFQNGEEIIRSDIYDRCRMKYYVNGAYNRASGLGAWDFWIVNDNRETVIKRSGIIGTRSQEPMILTAALEVYSYAHLKGIPEITVISDNANLVRTSKHLDIWKAKRFKRMPNKDLWEEVYGHKGLSFTLPDDEEGRWLRELFYDSQEELHKKTSPNKFYLRPDLRHVA